MRRVFRVVSALGAGAALVWGLAKSLRRKAGGDDNEGPQWPPKPEDTRRSDPEVRKDEPTTTEEPEPADEPEPVEEPEAPVEEPEAEEPEELVLKGVVIDDPKALVEFANGASEDDLREAGVKGKALSVVLEARPFADAPSIGETKGIGRRTLQTLCNAL